MNIKRLISALMAITACVSVSAKKPLKPILRFGSDGEFKILQFTDTHLIPSNETTPLVWENIRNAITAEKPDLIMLTGDQVYAKPALENYRILLDTLDKFGVPYGIVFGNHDKEFDQTNAALLKDAMTRPLCVAGDTPGLHGEGNYFLEVKSHSADTTASVVWCFDTGSASQFSKKEVKSYDYDYAHSGQIEWYGKASAAVTAEHGKKPLPSIAFMHIPLPEYSYAFRESLDFKSYGTHREAVCCPHLNSGLFCKMLECGDVMAVFCGHDHDNDCSVGYYGIMLAYGRYSGAATVYNNIGMNGSRVIVLHEGERKLDSYIRLRDGSTKDLTHYPEYYQ